MTKDYNFFNANDEETENKNFLESASKENETKEYIQTVLKGFVWIFMFVVSFVAIFLIFKTPYYQYYKNKAPIKLNSNGDVVENGNDITITDNKSYNPSEDFTNDTNNDMLENFSDDPNSSLNGNLKENSVANSQSENSASPTVVPSKVVKNEDSSPNLKLNSKNVKNTITENNKVSREETLKRELASNNKNHLNDSDLTNLLKNNRTLSDKQLARATTRPTPEVDSTNSANNVSSIASSNSNATQAPISVNSAKVTASNKSVWLVNIYSSTNKSTLKRSYNNLKNKYSALQNTSAYFTEFFHNKGKTYRISVAKNTAGHSGNSYFNTKYDASKFCATLKGQGLDCFVSMVFLPSLSKYAVK
ncbi:Sporulation related domain conataining protein [Candidatus Hepatincola sp. Av]